MEMIHRNESCTSGQVPMTYLSCLGYLLEEWTGAEYLEDCLNYVAYLLWVFTPLIIVFILPGLILLLLYISIIFLYVYKRKNELKEAYSNDIWDGARQMVATLWDGHAKIWHGYEVHGLEKIPDGPGLVVFYHGATPLDYFYFVAKLLMLKNRICYTVADHFVFKLPVKCLSARQRSVCRNKDNICKQQRCHLQVPVPVCSPTWLRLDILPLRS
ncbi:DGAT1/2-independent enzyme synthesizing storage lipids-like isoform X4 [Emydura macquarii macquarii]|uniref:DGAT1/2-independent enzyme synthesizing storage lipids-like isoform X4 n=1 Tax=Emydura macquarii macquarii TaxID=1129001 RepID=UPI00352B3E52